VQPLQDIVIRQYSEHRSVAPRSINGECDNISSSKCRSLVVDRSNWKTPFFGAAVCAASGEFPLG